MKTIKTTILGLMLLSFFISCDSDSDINLDGNADVCESAQIFAMRTSDHWAGTTARTGALNNTYTNFMPGAYDVSTITEVPIRAANSSTYNYDSEVYHFYSSRSTEFINMTLTGPETTALLEDGTADRCSGLVYVSSGSRYFLVRMNSDNSLSLLKVNPSTGGVLGVIDTGFSMPLGDLDSFGVRGISTATNGSGIVYILANKFLVSVNVNTGTSTSYELEALGTDNKFFGLEYRNEDNRLVALRHQNGENTHFVTINPDTPTPYEINADLTSFFPVTYTPFEKYSTTLNCDEGRYIIASLKANSSTEFVIIEQADFSAVNNTIDELFYYGIESNANN